MAFRFENLDIWKSSIRYTNHVYSTTKQFPRSELFSLTDQLKRSAVSISANIAEGSGSSSKKDFCHYLDISIKSLYESVSHLQLARELGYITDEGLELLKNEAEHLSKRIRAFKHSLIERT